MDNSPPPPPPPPPPHLPPNASPPPGDLVYSHYVFVGLLSYFIINDV